MTTYEEWRVTGTPTPGERPYTFTWSPHGTEGWDPEAEARRYVELIRECGDWTDGPHLHKRTVTVTNWEAIDGNG